jgi:hypothetical protein
MDEIQKQEGVEEMPETSSEETSIDAEPKIGDDEEEI